jgi:molybdopterin biosynthesis enzyme
VSLEETLINWAGPSSTAEQEKQNRSSTPSPRKVETLSDAGRATKSRSNPIATAKHRNVVREVTAPKSLSPFRQSATAACRIERADVLWRVS